MKNTLFLLSLFMLLACNNTIQKDKVVPKVSDTDTTKNVKSFYIEESEVTSDYKEFEETIKEVEIILKNKEDYSERFVQGLERLGYPKIELVDSLLIIGDADTVSFPSTPPLGKRITLTGRKENLAIAVTVKRINYTTVDYKIEMVEFGKTNYFKSGQAEITSGFFFGSESDESEKTGISYFVTEFTEFDESDCYNSIRLGYEEETGPYLLGKLVKNCNDKIKDINLDNFMLMEK